MITPTVGRVVLVVPSKSAKQDTRIDTNGLRHAGTVAKVNKDGTVNLGVVDCSGVAYNMISVVLVQDDEVPAAGQAEWMEYQKNQAAKAEPIEDNSKADGVITDGDTQYDSSGEIGGINGADVAEATENLEQKD